MGCGGGPERTDSEWGMLDGRAHPRHHTGAATARDKTRPLTTVRFDHCPICPLSYLTHGQTRDKTGPRPRPPLPHGLRHTRRHASAPSVARTRSCTQQEPRRLLRAWTKAAPATQLSRRNAASRLQVPRTCRSRTPSRRSPAHVTPLFDHFMFDLCHFDHYIDQAGAEHTQSESGRAGDAHAVHLLRSRAHDGAIRPQGGHRSI